MMMKANKKINILASLMLVSSSSFAAFDMGGEMRLRDQSFENRDFVKELDDSDSKVLTRVKFDFNYSADDLAARISPFYVGYWAQGSSSGTKSDYKGSSSDTTSGLGVYEAFVKWQYKDDQNFTIGRRNFELGRGRLIGNPTFSATDRAFDGLWFDRTNPINYVSDVKIFANVISENDYTGAESPGLSNQAVGVSDGRDMYLLGTNLMSVEWEKLFAEFTYLYREDGTTNGSTTVMNGKNPANEDNYANIQDDLTDKYLHTLMLSPTYVWGDFVLTADLGMQRGELRKITRDDPKKVRTVRSNFVDSELSYNFEKLSTKFKFGYTYASGPKHCQIDYPTDTYRCIEGSYNGWNPLYPNMIPVTGRMRMVHMTNLQAWRFVVSNQIYDNLSLEAGFYNFHKDEADAPAPTTEALPNYQNNGNQWRSQRSDPGNRNRLINLQEKSIGQEVDLYASYNLYKGFNVSGGYSWFNPGPVFKDQAIAHLFFAQGTWTF